MKRDFEREFRNIKLNETPDLWDRIEAALPEKNKSEAQTKDTFFNGKYHMSGMSVRKWGTLAAACLCIAVILPVISFVMADRKNNSDVNTAGGPDTDAMDSGEVYENNSAGYAETEKNMTEVSEMQSEPEKEHTDAKEGTEIQEDMKDGAAAGKLMMSDESSASYENKIEEAAAADVEAAYNDVEGIQLLDTEVTIKKVEKAGSSTVYKAVVKRADEGGVLNEGDEISIVCDAKTQFDSSISESEKETLEVEADYELTLRPEENDYIKESAKNGNAQSNRDADIAESSEKSGFTAVSVRKPE